jgi:hypothetical protein
MATTSRRKGGPGGPTEAAPNPVPLITPTARDTHRCAQFPRLCLLLTRNRKRGLEISLCFRCIRIGRYQRNFSGNTMDLRFAPSFRHVLWSFVSR